MIFSFAKPIPLSMFSLPVFGMRNDLSALENWLNPSSPSAFFVVAKSLSACASPPIDLIYCASAPSILSVVARRAKFAKMLLSARLAAFFAIGFITFSPACLIAGAAAFMSLLAPATATPPNASSPAA